MRISRTAFLIGIAMFGGCAAPDEAGFRGHRFKIDKHGQKVAAYAFGWDVTPAVYRHNGTYPIVIKDHRSWTPITQTREDP
jgi:hypothetical protein